MRTPRHLLGSAATVTTVPGGGGPANETDKIRPTAADQFSGARFDTNMVIILAALLCALVFALGLNSVVRCALRFSRRGLSEENATAAAAANTGLKKSALRKIPVAVYGSNGSSSLPEGTECPICLGEFVGGDKVRVLPKCNHRFHVRCIDTWLLSHSSCPNCRHSLAESRGPDAAAGEVVVPVADGDRAAGSS